MGHSWDLLPLGHELFHVLMDVQRLGRAQDYSTLEVA